MKFVRIVILLSYTKHKIRFQVRLRTWTLTVSRDQKIKHDILQVANIIFAKKIRRIKRIKIYNYLLEQSFSHSGRLQVVWVLV